MLSHSNGMGHSIGEFVTVCFLGVTSLLFKTMGFITLGTAVGMATIGAGISTMLLNYYRYLVMSGRITPKQKKTKEDVSK